MNNTIIKLLTQSYNHLLENNSGLNVSDLEAEIINIASFIYLKDKLDFTLDFVNEEVIEQLNSDDFNTVDAIIDNAVKLFSKYYTQVIAFNAKEAVRMNIQLMNNYDSFLKSYFISKHKQKSNVAYELFSSPLNSLWRDNKKISDSPTQRDVNYYFDFDNNTFEILINPYNPLVAGDIIEKKSDIIKCKSSDETREFEFIFKNNNLYEVVMHRINKGDTVKYHNE